MRIGESVTRGQDGKSGKASIGPVSDASPPVLGLRNPALGSRRLLASRLRPVLSAQRQMPAARLAVLCTHAQVSEGTRIVLALSPRVAWEGLPEDERRTIQASRRRILHLRLIKQERAFRCSPNSFVAVRH